VTHPLGRDDLVLCSGTVRSAPFDLTVRAAADAGFQGISLYYEEYRTARAAGWSDLDLRTFMDDHGITVAELDGRMDWLPGDAGAPSTGEFVAAAASLGARSITVLEIRGRRVGDTLALADVASAFASVCDQAADHDLLAHIEYFPQSGIPDLATAYEIVRAAGRGNGGVMVDSWHHLRGMDAGRFDPGFPGESILAVQLSDVAPVPSADLAHEMMHHRLLPGTGAGDLAGLVRAVRDRGCTAPLEVEVYSDELAALDPFLAARRAMHALREVLMDSLDSNDQDGPRRRGARPEGRLPP
jgi:sugar phosphate isomerase/epimerase